MVVSVNQNIIPGDYISFLEMYIDFKAMEVNSAYNGLVVQDGESVFIYEQAYLAEKAIEEILPNLPTWEQKELLKRHFDLQHFNSDGIAIVNLWAEIPTKPTPPTLPPKPLIEDDDWLPF